MGVGTGAGSVPLPGDGVLTLPRKGGPTSTSENRGLHRGSKGVCVLDPDAWALGFGPILPSLTQMRVRCQIWRDAMESDQRVLGNY